MNSICKQGNKPGRRHSPLPKRLIAALLSQPLPLIDLLSVDPRTAAVKMCLGRLVRSKLIQVVDCVRVERCKKPVKLYVATAAGLDFLRSESFQYETSWCSPVELLQG